jgi:hypothetical protein
VVLDTLEKTTDRTDSSNPYDTYAAVLGGPIFEEFHVEKLKKALRGFVTPGQCLGFLAQTRSALEKVYSGPSGQQSTPRAEGSERSRKRQKLDLDPSTRPPSEAIRFAFVCKVIAIVWPSLPFHSLTDEFRLEAVNEIQGVGTSVIAPLLSAELKRKRDVEWGSASRLWSRDVITSSALGLQYALSVCTPLNFRPVHDIKMESRMLRLLESPDVLQELKIEIVNRTLLLGKHTLTDLHSRADHFL